MKLIIVDSNEATTARAVVEKLNSFKDVKLEIVHLEVGDFITGKHMVERKRAGDFVQSIIDGRLWSQTKNLLHAAKEFKMTPIILIEGSISSLLRRRVLRNFNPRSLIGAWRSLMEEYGIRVVYSPNAFFTALWLMSYAEEKTKKEAIHAVRKSSKRTWPMDLKTRYVLEGFEGIGGVTSNRLLEQEGSLESVFEAALAGEVRDSRLARALDSICYTLRHKYRSSEKENESS